MKRREFLTLLAAASAGWAARHALAAPDTATPRTLPRRPLGRTGVELPVLGLGGYHLGMAADEKAARALVDAALEEGVRLFDNAESYHDGRSETLMGAALAGRRDDVFLMTKTHSPEDRSAESAKRHLEGSLHRLRTDRLDLWQLHSVKSPEDVDRSFAKGGAMEYIRRMKEEKVVRYTGVTGHVHPKANLRALHWFDQGLTFDVMQMPLNALDALQLSFQREVLPALVERGIGVLAMKTAASGALISKGLATPAECHRYVLGLPVSALVVGMETVAQVRENAANARLGTLPEAESRALVERLRPQARLSLEWYKQE